MRSAMRKFCFGLLIGTFVLAPAGYASVEFIGTAGSVIGKWKYKDTNLGPQILTFRKDGVYEVDTNGDGTKDIWGSYRISRDWFFLNDIGGDFVSDCAQQGAYTYRVKNNVLTFTLTADQCVPRSEAMIVEWQKIPKIYPPQITYKI